MKFSRYPILVVLMLVALLGPETSSGLHDGASAQAQAECTVTVRPGESIQTAIDQAEEGAVICLAAGTWEENIKVERSLTLRGVDAEQTVIDGIREGYPVVWTLTPGEGLQAVSVKVERLTIAGARGGCADQEKRICPAGMLIQGSAQVEITNSSISGNEWHGIWLREASQAKIADSTISGDSMWGIVLWGSAEMEIENSTISENGYGGIALDGLTHGTISKSALLENGGSGVSLMESAQMRISESTVSGNQNGILVGYSSQAIIEGNEITNNWGYGIALFHQPCFENSFAFSGHLAGRANTIPGPGEPDGNGKGAVCPEALDFLMTEEGGEYPLGPPTKGSPDAPVTMVEFSDFMCPYCARFAVNTLPKIEEEYVETGKVMVVFRNFPVHGEPSMRVAEAALCAHEQHRFWDYHDRLFADSLTQGRGVFNLGNLKALAAELGLDTARFNRCVDSRRYSEAVQEDIAEGNRLGVRGTPTFFINGREILGAQPYETFQRAIEEELAKEG